jgi:hypothetical protein
MANPVQSHGPFQMKQFPSLDYTVSTKKEKLTSLMNKIALGIMLTLGAALIIPAAGAVFGFSAAVLIAASFPVAIVAVGFLTGTISFAIFAPKKRHAQIYSLQEIKNLPELKDKKLEISDYLRYEILMHVDADWKNRDFSENPINKNQALDLLKNGYIGAIDLVKINALDDGFLKEAARACPLVMSYKPELYKDYRTNKAKMMDLMDNNGQMQNKVKENLEKFAHLPILQKIIDDKESPQFFDMSIFNAIGFKEFQDQEWWDIKKAAVASKVSSAELDNYSDDELNLIYDHIGIQRPNQ